MEEQQPQKPQKSLSHETIWGMPKDAIKMKTDCPLCDDNGKCPEGCCECLVFEIESGFLSQNKRLLGKDKI